MRCIMASNILMADPPSSAECHSSMLQRRRFNFSLPWNMHSRKPGPGRFDACVVFHVLHRTASSGRDGRPGMPSSVTSSLRVARSPTLHDSCTDLQVLGGGIMRDSWVVVQKGPVLLLLFFFSLNQQVRYAPPVLAYDVTSPPASRGGRRHVEPARY